MVFLQMIPFCNQILLIRRTNSCYETQLKIFQHEIYYLYLNNLATHSCFIQIIVFYDERQSENKKEKFKEYPYWFG